MEKLRKSFFLVAIALMAVTVGVEVGSRWLVKGRAVIGQGRSAALAQVPGLAAHEEDMDSERLDKLNGEKPPGVGIPYMALLDGLILYTVGLMGVSFFWGDRLHGRVQGLASLLVSLLVLIGAIALIFLTLAKVLLMVGLFVAAPFGTIAYMAIWGFFDRGAAQTSLGILMGLKLGFGACLVLAHQRFLQNKGLVLIILTSLLANLIVSFLHGLVPGFLVSITDGIAGLVVLILAAIWGIFLLVGSIISVVKAIV